MYIMMSKKNKRKIPNLMFSMQALVDLFVALSAITAHFFFHEDHATNYSIHVAFHLLFGYTMFLAPSFLLLSSTERFLAMVFPLHHRTVVSKDRMAFTILFIFVVNMFPSVVFVSYVNFARINPTWNKFLITTGIIQLVEIAIVYVLLSVTHITIKNNIKRNITRLQLYFSSKKEHSNPVCYVRSSLSRHRNSIELEKKKDLRITRIHFIMCTVYALTFLPSPCNFLYRGFSSEYTMTNAAIENTFALLYYISAVINPVITIACIDDFKNGIYIISNCASSPPDIWKCVIGLPGISLPLIKQNAQHIERLN